MRCPKCGYISFDHVETCLKCNKDISGKVEVEGTTYQAAAPSFFKVPGADNQTDGNDLIHSDSGSDTEEFDFTDPDLDVLVGDDEEFGFDDDDEATISFDDASLDDVADDFQLEVDDTDGDDAFSFDLGDDEELGGEQTAPELNVPDELSDISDLAPPEPALAATATEKNDISLSLDDEMALDEDLDLDGLDLNLGLGEVADDVEGGLSLSLDDIDISMDEDTPSSEDSDLDGLNMDLDLGDFDIEEPKEKKSKSLEGLDDISLSLD